jgi:hypothetical protein
LGGVLVQIAQVHNLALLLQEGRNVLACLYNVNEMNFGAVGMGLVKVEELTSRPCGIGGCSIGTGACILTGWEYLIGSDC